LSALFPILIARKGAAGLLILGLVGLLYADSLGNAFQYDDRHSIVENPHIRSLENLPGFFVEPEHFSRDADKAMYRPLVLVSLALNHAWSGYETYSYHLINVLLHGLCALLVWGILLESRLSSRTALMGGLLFAAHPLGSEPVNYISSRSELLGAGGVLGSFWLYQLAEDRPGWKGRTGSVLLFAGGLLAKSVAIVLPVLLACRDYGRGRLDREGAKRYLPYGIVALVYLVLVRGFLTRAVLTQPVRSMTVQLGTQTKALLYYLKLFFMPVGLNVHHAFAESSLFEELPLVCLLALASLLVCCRRGIQKREHVFLGLTWMLVTLAPTLIVPLNVLVNEHRLYLPLVGFIIALSGLGKVSGRGWGVVLFLVFLGVLTAKRSAVWENEHTLWADAARKAPGEVRPYVYMGNYARAVGEPEKALTYYQQALELEPRNPAALANLGNACRDLGRLEEAADIFRGILMDHPEMGDVRYSLARVHQEAGDVEQARVHYLAVPVESAHYQLALNNLGTLHEKEGQVDSALYYYRRVLGENPESPEGRANLDRFLRELVRKVEALFAKGDFKQAEAVCRQVLREDGRHRQARFFLAVSLFQQARYSESIAENQKLVELHPHFDDGWLQLANALEASGRLEEARQAYEELLARARSADLRQVAGQRLRRLLERTR